MSLMLKSLSITAILASSLFANATVDKVVTEFQTNRISANPQVKLESLSIFLKKELPTGWYGYVFDIKANVNGQTVEAKDTVFSNGTLVTPELMDVKNGRSFKDALTPSMSNEYYSEKHLIAGNKNAKHKVVIFSDPLCAFCVDYLPEAINKAKQNPDLIALYYYHFPLLRIHPAADVVTRAMIVAKEKGVKDIELKIYQANLLDSLSSKESNQQLILDSVNKVLKTSITLKEIDAPKIVSQLEKDMKMTDDMMVQGTPTIFVDGQMDRNRRVFEGLKK
jgi:thiol:disulfide interchange protein DsbC